MALMTPKPLFINNYNDGNEKGLMHSSTAQSHLSTICLKGIAPFFLITLSFSSCWNWAQSQKRMKHYFFDLMQEQNLI